MKKSENSEEISTGIGRDGLSLNHKELSPEKQEMEASTADRRKPLAIEIKALRNKILVNQDGQKLEGKFVATAAQSIRKDYNALDMEYYPN